MHPDKRQDRKERLLLAASEVFSEKGYAGTTVADVAERVGVGKGTVYGYYESKDDLFLDLFNWYVRRMEKEIRPELATLGQSAGSRLLALGDAVIQAELNNLESYTLSLEFWAATASSAHRKLFRKAFSDAYAHWREIIANILSRGIAQGEFREDVEVEDFALGIVAMWDAAVLQYWIDSGTNPVKGVRSSVQAMLEGITVREN